MAFSNTLFNQKRITTYHHLIEKGKALADKKDAITFFEQMNLGDFGPYPDHRMELAYSMLRVAHKLDKPEDFKKKKDLLLSALNQYELILKSAPFNHTIIFLRDGLKKKINAELQQNKLQPIFTDAELAISNQKAIIFKKQEKDYVTSYHTRLYMALHHLPDQPESFKSIKSDDNIINYSVTNGACEFSYLGTSAFSYDNFTLAAYYLEKAILRFNHDFISQSIRASIYYFSGEIERAIYEFTFIIDQYKYHRAYYLRGLIYQDLNEMEQACDDYINSFVRCDKVDFDFYGLSLNKSLRLVLNIKDKTNPTPESLFQLSNEYIIKKYYELALLHISIGILLVDAKDAAEYYFQRTKIQIYLGRNHAAQLDISNTVTYAADKAKQADYLFQFKSLCKIHAKLFLAQENVTDAVKIFQLVLENSPRPLDFIEMAEALNNYGDHEGAITLIDYISAQDIHLPSMKKRLIELRSKYLKNHAQQKKEAAKAVENNEKQEEITKARKKPLKKTSTLFSLPATAKRSQHVHRYADICGLLDSKNELIETMAAENCEQEKNVVQNNLSPISSDAKIKATRRDRRTKTPRETNDSDDEAIHQATDYLLSLIPANKDTNDILDNVVIELHPAEKTIFDIFEKYNTTLEKGKMPYLTYGVGGSVFDRLRKKLFNFSHEEIDDIDIVTEVPPDILEQLFRDFTGFHHSTFMPELFVFQLGNVKVDIIHASSLTKLYDNAKNRDFFAYYVDKDGKILDPIRFGIAKMELNQLRSIPVPSKVFEEDPIRILRAIYYSKRNLIIPSNLLEFIHKYKSSLIPDVSQPFSLLSPQRMNTWILKVLSKKMAVNNYRQLANLEILDILFPDIANELAEDHDWIIEQLGKTDFCKKANLEIIYVTFITAAVLIRKRNNISLNIHEEYDKIINNSPLFSHAFAKSRYRDINIRYALNSRLSWQPDTTPMYTMAKTPLSF